MVVAGFLDAVVDGTFFIELIICMNARTKPNRIRNGNKMRNHEIPGCPLSHKKLRKYVHTKFINKCHIVATTCAELAENARVEISDIPRYSWAGVHK